MFKIKIVAYDGNKGRYESFNEITFDTAELAIEEASRIRALTGKCYGVFGPNGKVHDTSSYYYRMNLPEWA